MPRGPRLDAPGTLHYVIIRGIERGAIVLDDADRMEVLRRTGIAEVHAPPVVGLRAIFQQAAQSCGAPFSEQVYIDYL